MGIFSLIPSAVSFAFLWHTHTHTHIVYLSVCLSLSLSLSPPPPLPLSLSFSLSLSLRSSDCGLLSPVLLTQCSKLLGDTNVIKFYPSKFVLITDILDTFGEFFPPSPSLLLTMELRKTSLFQFPFLSCRQCLHCQRSKVMKSCLFTMGLERFVEVFVFCVCMCFDVFCLCLLCMLVYVCCTGRLVYDRIWRKATIVSPGSSKPTMLPG